MNDRQKANPQQVARAGEHFVAAELHRCGAYAVTFAGNMPKIDVVASDKEQRRTVSIQVKSKSSRSPGWQTQTTRGQQRSPDPDESRFWILVDLGDVGDAPSYYVIPEWWIQNDIYEAFTEYKERLGGQRPRTLNSTHHKIDRRRIEHWRDRWDILAIFSDDVIEEPRSVIPPS